MKRLQHLLPALGLVLLFLFLFWEPLFGPESLFSPDGPPFYVDQYAQKLNRGFFARWDQSMLGVGTGARPFYPQKLLALSLPPLVYHQWGYIFSLGLVAFATTFYLRGHGFRGPVIWASAAAMTFSGYHFTLIAAGHRGVFDMTGWILLVFGALDRAITQRQWPYFAMVGAGTAHALAAQPDVTLLYLLAAGAYALFLAIQAFREQPRGPLIRRLGGGGILTAIVFLLLSLNTFGNLFRNIMPQRESSRGQTSEEKWIFATNWSLPPSEILEFAVPGVYGAETGSPTRPYWGEVGRAYEWESHQQGLKNLKQHTVYLGLLQLLFAGYLVARSLRPQGDAAIPRSWCLFWLGIWIFALLFALGRYAPFYKLIYSLPRFDAIRAPIKFVHLMEWATTLLFAGGLATFLQDLSSRKAAALRGLGISASVGAVLLLLLWVGMLGRPEASANLLGMQSALPAMKTGLNESFLHGVLLSGLLAALCFTSMKWQSVSRFIPASIVVLLFLDLAYVGKPYIHTRDVSAHYAANPVAEALASESPVPPRVSWRLPIPIAWHHPVAGNFLVKFTRYLEPAAHKGPDPQHQDFFAAMPKTMQGYLRLLDLSSTSGILCEKNMAAVLDRVPGAERTMSFAPNPAGGVLETNPKRAWGFLYHYQPILPRASVVYAWEQHPASNVVAHLFDANWNPANTVLVTEDYTPSFPANETPSSPATITSYRSNYIAVEGEAAHPGILRLVERWDPDWKIVLNGNKVDSHPVNGLLRGIEVPAGTFSIEMHYRPFLIPYTLNLLTTACVWPGLLFYAFRQRKRERKEAS